MKIHNARHPNPSVQPAPAAPSTPVPSTAAPSRQVRGSRKPVAPLPTGRRRPLPVPTPGVERQPTMAEMDQQRSESGSAGAIPQGMIRANMQRRPR